MGKKRVKLKGKKEEPQNYFLSEKTNLSFVHSGCTTLDCSLGGGYPLGRMVNIVGDKSTAKTALGTEAMINFKDAYPDGIAAYRETEGAYDTSYAEEMGLPIDEIDLGDPENPVITVEQFDKDFRAFINKCTEADVPGIYVLDSFDSLSDEAEMNREMTDGSYNMNKQKQIGIMFRKLNKKIEKSKVLLIIISQVRENIGVSFGEKYRRGGGKALDFYASQIFWLAHTGQLTKTVKGVKRAYGVSIKSKCKKNKVGFPFREAEFDFIFGFGIDDVGACVKFLETAKRLSDFGYKNDAKGRNSYISDIDKMSDKDYRRERAKLRKHVKKIWNEIEEGFLPKRRKYRRP